MGLDPVTIGYLAVAATTTAVSYSQQRSAQRDQREANAVQGAQQQIEARRRKRMAARQARIRRAQILQASRNTGVGGASGVTAAGSAAARGVSEQSSYLYGNQVAASAISRLGQQAADKQLRAGIADSVTRMAAGAASDPNQVQLTRDFFGMNQE